MKPGRLWQIALVVAIIVFLLPVIGAGFFTEYLWFADLGYIQVFMIRYIQQVIWGLVAGTFFGLTVYVNIMVARGRRRIVTPTAPTFQGNFASIITSISGLAISVIVCILSGLTVAPHWLTIQGFLKKVANGEADPLFGKDISFYFFDLPFWTLIYRYLFSLLNICLITAFLTYLFSGLLNFEENRIGIHSKARSHLGIICALILVLKGLGYILASYNLVYSPRGAAFGASYTDVYLQIPALKILMVLAFICGLLVLYSAYARSVKLLVWPVIGLIVSSVLLGNVVPGIVQRLVVSPNELAKESPFIENNILMTKKGFNLDQVVEMEYPGSDELNWARLEENQDILSNIRIWDYRPAQQTFSQVQEIRLYYNFKDVDIDRYHYGGQYRQVIVSAREMDISRLPQEANTWVNRHLKFTHGYGIVLAPSNEVSAQGLPQFQIRDIPPVSSAPELEVKVPQIYFGEMTDDYIIVKTREKEFDHPVGDENAETIYAADSGIRVYPLVNRLALATRLGDYQIMFSGSITPESKLIFRRTITDRVNALAPFLMMDRDPYIVLNEGKLYWILDCYSVSSRFPYSQPYKYGFNYIRNSVKAVIDAYTGDVSLYIFDEGDPIVQTYARIFPGLFKPGDSIPEGLVPHLRYPEDMFTAQAAIYSTYHMNNPTVYYNKEDYWAVPEEIVGTQKQPVEPYYIMTRLPGEDKLEFDLILPFSPKEKGNMISWLAARSDPENFGQLLLFKLPKDRITYGPIQMEGFIDQDSTISQNLTLWGQAGTEIYRGNLITLPIAGSMLYIEPLYLQARDNKLPELKRIIAGYGGRVEMAPTMEEALAALFGVRQLPVEQTEQLPPVKPGSNIYDLIKKAGDLYAQAQERLRSGDFAEYGRLIKELGDVLTAMGSQTGGE